MMDCENFIELTKRINTDVVIFGAGEYGRTWCYALLCDAGFSVVCYIDNYRAGDNCNGLPIYSIEYLEENRDTFAFVSTRGNAEIEMVNQLKIMGIQNYFHFESEYAPVDFAQYLENTGDKELINMFPSVMDDETYLKVRFKYRMGKELDLENPKTFNEKLNWLKLHDRNPLYTMMVDKYAVKEYVSNKIGKEHVIPLFGVWNHFDDIDYDLLPDQFVLKCTHDSGGMVICRNKKEFDVQSARIILERCLKNNTYWADREWPYKNVKPRIIAEKYIDSLGNVDSVEYKATCINGKVDFVTFCRGVAHASLDVRTNDHYSRDFNKIPFYAFYKNSDIEFDKPRQWDELIQCAEELAEGIPQVRIDFYIDKGIVLFGEITFFTWSACIKFVPEEFDSILGKKIVLPELCD